MAAYCSCVMGLALLLFPVASQASSPWTINYLTTHFANGGGAAMAVVPESQTPSQFFSAINFIFNRAVPVSHSAFPMVYVAECNSTWIGSDIPLYWSKCNDTRVRWRLEKNSFKDLSNFTLEVAVMNDDSAGDLPNDPQRAVVLAYATKHFFSSSDIPAPDGFLSCFASSPNTVTACVLPGNATSQFSELAVEPRYSASYTPKGFEIEELSIFYPPPEGKCSTKLNFTLSDTDVAYLDKVSEVKAAATTASATGPKPGPNQFFWGAIHTVGTNPPVLSATQASATGPKPGSAQFFSGAIHSVGTFPPVLTVPTSTTAIPTPSVGTVPSSSCHTSSHRPGFWKSFGSFKQFQARSSQSPAIGQSNFFWGAIHTVGTNPPVLSVVNAPATGPKPGPSNFFWGAIHTVGTNPPVLSPVPRAQPVVRKGGDSQKASITNCELSCADYETEIKPQWRPCENPDFLFRFNYDTRESKLEVIHRHRLDEVLKLHNDDTSDLHPAWNAEIEVQAEGTALLHDGDTLDCTSNGPNCHLKNPPMQINVTVSYAA